MRSEAPARCFKGHGNSERGLKGLRGLRGLRGSKRLSEPGHHLQFLRTCKPLLNLS